MGTGDAYVIGVDYGTDSVRTVVVDTANGGEISSSVFYYPRWKKQWYCNANMHEFRQHPLDYVEGLEFTIKDCVSKIGTEKAACIKAVSIDTTGSTPVAVDKSGTPIALLPGFEENPNAMFVLWKDHSAVKEAAEINAHGKKFDTDYLKYVGGIYSSEWFWAKILHVLRVDEAVRKSTYSFVEHCDWIPFLLTGGKDIHAMKRGVCSAGHKALWSSEWGGLPPNSFFKSLDPLLDGYVDQLFTEVLSLDQPVGVISSDWASRLGLPVNTIIGVGAFDAHMGAVGGQIEPYHLSKVMGTSTCDMLVAPMDEVKDILVKGICGQVPGSVIPGMMGMEAGQSAFGDAYAWYKKILTWPLEQILSQTEIVDEIVRKKLIEETEGKIISQLSKAAETLPLDEKCEWAMDWFNGRRTPDANQTLTAFIGGLDLASDAVSIFRAIVEATCFGAKAIVERFEQEGISVKGLIGLGGVARKSPFIMQMMADVMNMPIRIHRSEQTCALGAAMFAATAAGIYKKVEDAMKAMGPGFDAVYEPDQTKVGIYKIRYENYKKMGTFIASTQSA